MLPANPVPLSLRFASSGALSVTGSTESTLTPRARAGAIRAVSQAWRLAGSVSWAFDTRGAANLPAGLQVLVEPADQPRHDVDLVLVLEEEMPLVRVDDELGLDAQALQRVPVLVRLADRHFRIAVAAHHEGWRVHVLDEGDRRAALVDLRIVVHRCAEVGDHPGIDVVGTVVAQPVGESRPRDRGLEAVGLSQRPHRHVAAVAPAG